MPNPTSRRVKVPPLSDLITLPEAMALTGHSKRTMHRLAAEGYLTVYKVGSRNNHYSLTELQRLITSGRSGGRSVRISSSDDAACEAVSTDA
jgi:predicted DNA-binding transcriptional regulator AlpA